MDVQIAQPRLSPQVTSQLLNLPEGLAVIR